MNQGASTWYGKVNEDGSYSVLARITSLSGSGAEVAPGEGNLLQQIDITSVSVKVYDLGTNRDSTSGTEITPAPTVVVATSVYDTLQTTGWATSNFSGGGSGAGGVGGSPGDPYGYNFRHDLGGAYAPEAGRWYLLEYKFILAGADGGVIWLRVKVKSVGVLTS